MNSVSLPLACALLLLAGAAGCTWVELTEPGKKVQVVPAEAASGCEKVGSVNANTADRIGFIARSEATVHRELDAIARNEAAKLGGDTLVPLGVMQGGRRSFEVYRCGTR